MASPAVPPATGEAKNEAEVDAMSFWGPRNPQIALIQMDGWSSTLLLESQRLDHPRTG